MTPATQNSIIFAKGPQSIKRPYPMSTQVDLSLAARLLIINQPLEIARPARQVTASTAQAQVLHASSVIHSIS